MKSILFFAMTYSLFGFAFEVDNFTDRYRKDELQDASPMINGEIERVFDEVIKEANKQPIDCNGEPADIMQHPAVRFRKILKEHIAKNNDIGEIESWAMSCKGIVNKVKSFFGTCEDATIPRFKPGKDHLYKYSDEVNVRSFAGLGYSMRIGSHFIGTDKLGHFFDQGFRYFDTTRKTVRSHGRPMSRVGDALALGHVWEGSDRGRLTTGVTSYADLSANLSGLIFWQQVASGPSPYLVKDPYFICENGQWRRNKKFQIQDFVNASWDEGINCNKYWGQTETAVNKYVTEMQQATHKNFTCPVEPEKCAEIVKHIRTTKADDDKKYSDGIIFEKGFWSFASINAPAPLRSNSGEAVLMTNAEGFPLRTVISPECLKVGEEMLSKKQLSHKKDIKSVKGRH